MKICLKDLIWLFLFFITIFFMGMSVGKMSNKMIALSYSLFIILISLKSNHICCKHYSKIFDESSEKMSEIDKEAIQKIEEINQSYSNTIK